MYPHCDPQILHSPAWGCVYCDRHPEEQEMRRRSGVNFTGENNPNKTPCPADLARGDTHMQWGGNVAKDKNGMLVLPPPAESDVKAAASTIMRILENE